MPGKFGSSGFGDRPGKMVQAGKKKKKKKNHMPKSDGYSKGKK